MLNTYSSHRPATIFRVEVESSYVCSRLGHAKLKGLHSITAYPSVVGASGQHC